MLRAEEVPYSCLDIICVGILGKRFNGVTLTQWTWNEVFISSRNFGKINFASV